MLNFGILIARFLGWELQLLREKGAVTQVRINSVTIVRKKFSEFFGAVQLISFSVIFMFLMRR